MSRVYRTMGTLAGTLSLVGVLTACASPTPTGPVTRDVPDITASPTAQLAPPPGSTLLRSVELSSPPEAIDGTFIGMRFPGDFEKSSPTDLTIVAFNAQENLWALTTNPACGMFALTEDGQGEPLVVALNSDARIERGKIAEHTIASAFNADTGTAVWEDIAVPGPLTSTSLVFSELQASVVQEPPIPRITLQPDTGDSFSPADHSWPHHRIEYEHRGLAAIRDANNLGVFSTHDGELLWEHPEPLGHVSELSAGLALVVNTGERGSELLILHTPTGESAGAWSQVHRVNSSADGSTTVVTATSPSGEHTLILLTEDGIEWQLPIDGDLPHVDSLTPTTIFLTDGNDTVALATRDGEEVLRGSFSSPTTITQDGVATLPSPDPHTYEVIQLAERFY